MSCSFSIPTSRKGFTILELMVSTVILAILASAAVPVSKMMVKRKKEASLRASLLEMRTAIDRYRQAVEEGIIKKPPLDQYGYPADFEELVFGAPHAMKPSITIRFLRRIPVDPMTGEAKWGMRSVQDAPDSTTWGGQNLFDVYSLSDGTAIDQTEYSQW